MILLFIIQLIIIIGLIVALVIVLSKFPEKLETAILEQYWDDEIDILYPCTLLTQIVPDEFDGLDWDFSRYESDKIIAMIIHTMDEPEDIYEMQADAEAKIREELDVPDEVDLGIDWSVGVIPKAYVYKTVGGKIRCYIK